MMGGSDRGLTSAGAAGLGRSAAVLAALWAMTLLWGSAAGIARAHERSLRVEVQVELEVAGGAWPDGRCEVELGLAPGHQGLVAARRPGLIEVAARGLLAGGSRPLTAGWDGVWLSFRGVGACAGLIEAALGVWRGAGRLEVPQGGPPAVTPPELEGLRAEAGLADAVAMALGAAETSDGDASQLELLVDALALAPGRLVVRGRPTGRDRRALPRSAELVAPAPRLTPRSALMPMAADGTTRLYAMWQLADEDRALGPVLAALLGHPGHRLHERLVADMGLVHTLEVKWLEGPGLLVVVASLPGPGHGAALDRLFIELATLARSLREDPAEHGAALTGAAALARVETPSAREISNGIAGLDRERATLLVAPGREDLDTQVAHIDSALILRWVAATMDLRCPAPDETRDKNTLLKERHQLEPRRYLAMTRALGRDAERMRQLDRELVDRCEEDKKLRRMLRPESILKLHREVRCGAVAGPDAAEEIARRKVLFRRYRVDSSAYRPLVAMLRRSPVHAVALGEVEARCEVAP